MAHVRSSGIVIDLGVRSRHKHTLGDWASGWSGDFEEDGRTYSTIAGPRALLFADAFEEEAGGGSIFIAVRAGSSRSAYVSLNGIEIGWLDAPEDFFETMAIPFDEGLVAGTNEVAIEPEEPFCPSEAGCPLLDVDWVIIAPGNAKETTLRPAAPAPRCDGLSVPPGGSATFNVILDEGVRLEADAASSTGERGTLEIAIRSEPDEIARRARTEIVAEPSDLSLSLEDLGGRAVSITFEAAGAPVSLRRAVLSPGGEDLDPGTVPAARNLLVVLVDTLRADRLRIYNPATRVRTPSLSRLARSSVVFERAMAPESWTKPSVSSLLTGLYPDSHGVQSHGASLPPTVAYAPEILREQGFDTAAFLGNGYISKQHGFARGWDTWTTFDGATGMNTARRIVDSAIRWLGSHPADRRFFAYLHTVDPHAPYAAPSSYRHLYVQRRYRGVPRPCSTAAVLREHGAGRFTLGSLDRQWLEDLYDGEVTYNDFHLGRLMGALERSGLADETLVVITADHGEEFLDHGRLGHGYSVYEELVHVPLIMRAPGGATLRSPPRPARAPAPRDHRGSRWSAAARPASSSIWTSIHARPSTSPRSTRRRSPPCATPSAITSDAWCQMTGTHRPRRPKDSAMSRRSWTTRRGASSRRSGTSTIEGAA